VDATLMDTRGTQLQTAMGQSSKTVQLEAADNAARISPTTYEFKVRLLIFLVLADAISNAGFDYSASQPALVTYFTLQVVLHLALLLSSFLLSWNTFLQRFGLLGMACRDAWPLAASAALRALDSTADRRELSNTSEPLGSSYLAWTTGESLIYGSEGIAGECMALC
ncbi:hypothetical protein FOZ63_026509, partial [Perkinsus olseni]